VGIGGVGHDAWDDVYGATAGHFFIDDTLFRITILALDASRALFVYMWHYARAVSDRTMHHRCRRDRVGGWER